MNSQLLMLFISLSLITLFHPPLYAQSKCAIESFPHIPDVIIKSATLESSPVKHCKVNGVIDSEAHFELLLPQDYNGKFVMGGGGGFVGIIMNAAQDFIGVIEKGYATVATDTGHQKWSRSLDQHHGVLSYFCSSMCPPSSPRGRGSVF